ncbi:NUDIX hydrolase [Rhodococcus kroppenstedtii]|uniref:ADP-ribose pyrophosphatase n=1 Tax=Rhodococcoides kroppenstedtii TaxID=293050 RepID=A0A1I0UBU3_9NOCA|nr:NUDIX hydrolase [Rhodococcus kroppenstedtii]MBY6436133.1 NUDIX hydrolase [Rhodococcus kroppenstedtii]MDV7199254.1 NUDIX hydrolase [Rhodococcus kroppenstedtii]NIL82175.1 Methanol dehydrogenase activator [Rhodococcus kroppenstedtii]SFA61380.1 ADP-ribose pyrophosphatase [Rhodococcus kroppenstedtii]
MAERHDFEVLGSELEYQGAILALRRDRVAMPGGRTAEREVIEHHGAVAVVAIDDEDRIVLIEQYRHPLGRRLLELPAGLLDEPGEDPVDAVGRELTEETGLAAESFSVLVDVAASPGFTDETVRIFLAEGLSEVDRPEARDEEADIELVRLSVEDALARVLSGEIVNASAVAGILAVAAVRSRSVPMRPADAPWRDRPTAFEQRRAHGG